MENEVNKTEQVTENKEKVKEKESAIILSDSELSKKELQDKLQALKKREKELAKKEKEIARKEMEIKVSETLRKNGLDAKLGKYLNIEGVEDVEGYVKEIKEVLGSQMQQTYKPNAHKGTTEGITKEQFNKMSYADRLNLFKNNKELYEQLSK
jgi:hypothetical protein